MPLYDGWSRLLYRLLLRAVVDDPATRRKLLPRYGILAKRPVISSAFLPALNNPNTNLITTPIERITATGIRTIDGVEHPAELLVLATGYELWIDPETYRPDTILGACGFDLARYYRAHGLHSYAGTAHPRLPNRWEIVGPLGFVGFAWLDYVETVAAHAVRIIDETRHRGAQVATVSQDAFNLWNERMRRDGRVAHLYYTATSGLNTYFVNSAVRNPVLPAADDHRIPAVRPPLSAVRLRVHHCPCHRATRGATRMSPTDERLREEPTDQRPTGRAGRLRHRSRARPGPLALRSGWPAPVRTSSRSTPVHPSPSTTGMPPPPRRTSPRPWHWSRARGARSWPARSTCATPKVNAGWWPTRSNSSAASTSSWPMPVCSTGAGCGRSRPSSGRTSSMSISPECSTPCRRWCHR